MASSSSSHMGMSMGHLGLSVLASPFPPSWTAFFRNPDPGALPPSVAPIAVSMPGHGPDSDATSDWELVSSGSGSPHALDRVPAPYRGVPGGPNPPPPPPPPAPVAAPAPRRRRAAAKAKPKAKSKARS